MGDSTLEQRDGILADWTSPIQVDTVPRIGDGISDKARSRSSSEAMGSMDEGLVCSSPEEKERSLDHELHFTFDMDTPGTRRDCALIEKYLKDILRNHKYMINAGFESGPTITQTVFNIINALGQIKSIK